MSFMPMPMMVGQRFRQLDGRDQEQEVTVVRLVEDAMGFRRVVFQAPGGREIHAFASQIEAAIAGGHLSPVEDLFGVTILDRHPVEQLAS
ncbi:MAG: hypothetical protein M3464_07760 [Chloroflexota bacterium]|nr:hypothetical protein [Chloroflexota bacterium]